MGYGRILGLFNCNITRAYLALSNLIVFKDEIENSKDLIPVFILCISSDSDTFNT